MPINERSNGIEEREREKQWLSDNQVNLGNEDIYRRVRDMMKYNDCYESKI